MNFQIKKYFSGILLIIVIVCESAGNNKCIELFLNNEYQQTIDCIHSRNKDPFTTLATFMVVRSFTKLQLYDSAIIYINEFFLEDKFKEDSLYREIFLDATRSYLGLTLYNETIDFYRRNFDAVKSLDDSLFMYKAFYNRAKAFFELGDYFTALDYYKESEKYTQKISYERYYAQLGIANALYANGMNDSSYNSINSIMNNPHYHAYFNRYTYFTYMNILLANGYYEKSDSLISSVAKEYLDVNDPWRIQFLKGAIVGSYLTGNLSQLEKYLAMARQEAPEVRAYLEYDFFNFSFDVYKNFGRERDMILRNKLINNELSQMLSTREKLASSEMRHQIEIKDLENRNLKKDQVLKQTQIAKQKSWLVATGLGLLTILATSLLVYRTSRERKKNNEILETKNEELAAQKEKIELLHRELSHRSNSNLTLVNNLLQFQKDQIEEYTVEEILEQNVKRVQALSSVQRHLSSRNNIATNDAIAITQLAQNLVQGQKPHVDLDIDLATSDLNSDNLVFMSIIINELITNSLKYAFVNQDKPEISIKSEAKSGALCFEYRDNGIGHNNSAKGTGKGMELVNLFVNQLGGRSHSNSENGYFFTFEFPVKY